MKDAKTFLSCESAAALVVGCVALSGIRIEPGDSEAVEDFEDILKPAQTAKAAKRANRILEQWRSRSGGN